MTTTGQIPKKNSIRSYEFVLTPFDNQFGAREVSSTTPDEILRFLNQITEGKKQTTKRTRYSCLKAFFNLLRNTIDPTIQNPCNVPMVKKLYGYARNPLPNILEKEEIDEIIFKTQRPRNRLIMELMARGGMRVGEVLQLTPRDVQERKLVLRRPKSGKENEPVFIPKKVADRLRRYIRAKDIRPDQRIFPLTYAGARCIVVNAGKVVGLYVRPHDLRRHAATYASRSGTPIGIVSDIILRHSHLSTTQHYLGKVTDEEAMRWIDNLHA